MGLTISTPYEGLGGEWYRGNLHAHTTNSDGERTPEGLVSRYSDLNYDWVSITDHDYLTPPPDSANPRLTVIPGNEITGKGPHLLHIGAQKKVPPDSKRENVVREVLGQGGLCILNHPNWGVDFVHWPQRLLKSIVGYHGIEIYNGVVRRLEGSPLATDRWDRLLSMGRRICGYANDDAHLDCDYGIAWNVVNCASNTANEINAALKRGCFYASTGVVLTVLRTCKNRIRIVSQNGGLCVAIVDHGIEILRMPGRSWEFDLESLTTEWRPSYLRFEIRGEGDATAWSQPIFLKWK